ncbi:NitT/TauT family transport system substrate-binding protein [Hamadaea flava]|uniref:ABC transporter substrate-binding protein n=1 Tax=Hamadaea flava TaxID=1742688 RepID=A0ABV8LS13_9ACTN|nr:ABC transporter substrate-binding protein [Hamadaea flava]MCP2322330.1 NitT/TauT family transport system substrate-binding protein [Hamadaea flava]
MQDSITRVTLTRRGALTAFALALPLAASACGEDTPSTSNSGGGTTTVKVGVISIIDVAPIYLGVSKGFFKDAGLDLKLETASGGAAIVPAVVAGQYQFGFSNTVSLLLASSKGLKLKAVAAGVSTVGTEGKDFGAVVVKADSPIKSAADLAGKKIAVNTLNNINTTTVNEVVRKAGGDPSKITYVELGFPDIVAAIAKGDVDAGQVVEPFLTTATQAGNRQVVSNYAGTDPNLTVAAYFTSADYASKSPKVVESFKTAMTKSLTYANEHPDEVRAILATYTKIDAKVSAAVILPRWTGTIDQASVAKLAELAQKDGFLTATPDIAALIG